jgi:hypothetical protein
MRVLGGFEQDGEFAGLYVAGAILRQAFPGVCQIWQIFILVYSNIE